MQFSFKIHKIAGKLYFSIFLIFVSLILLLPFYSGRFYLNHDAEVHLVRSVEYMRAFLDGQIPPRWAPNLNFGFGSPVFIVFYPLAGYLIALLHLLGLSLEHSFMFLAGMAFILGPLGLFLWLREKYDDFTAFLAALFFSVIPYRFLTLYVRGSIGELIALGLIPFIFYCLESRRSKILVGGILYGLLVLSHNGLSLIFTPIFILYSFFIAKKHREILLMLVIGLGLSSYFWIPALIESKYTSFLLYYKDMYRDNFISFLSLIYSPWGFETRINEQGGLSAQIGVPGAIMLLSVTVIIFFRRNKKQTSFFLFWLAILLIGIFLSTALSSSLWEISDFLKKFQFPWRFLVIASFATSAISPILFSNTSKRIALVIITLCIVYSLPFIKVQKYITRGDNYYYSYQGSSTHRAEATPIWSPGDPSRKALSRLEIIGGQAILKNVHFQSTKHSFTVLSRTGAAILDNTLYFPGWTLRIDGEKTPLEFQDPNHQGLITFHVPAGEHNVEVAFENTKVRLVGNIISFISILAVGGYVFALKLKNSNMRE